MRRRGTLTLSAISGLAAVLLLAACGGEKSRADNVSEIPASFTRNRDGSLHNNGPFDPAATTVPKDQANSPLGAAIDRKIVKSATIELSVENVAASVTEIETIAEVAGGFVSGSSIFVEDRPAPEVGDGTQPVRTQSGTMTIRVPADSYASVLQKLRGVADEVVSENSTAEEVTEEYTDLQARLRNLKATEVQYLELLKQAKAIPDIITVQDKLNEVRGQIEQAQGRISVLTDLSDLATITVQLTPTALVRTDGNRSWATAAWEESLAFAEGTMVVGATVAIFAGVSLLWLVPLMLIIAIIWRLFGRRVASSLHRLLSVN